jgi:hypothetical protein
LESLDRDEQLILPIQGLMQRLERLPLILLRKNQLLEQSSR